MLDHFAECVKQAKGVRQQAVQLNIFTAVLSALKVGALRAHKCAGTYQCVLKGQAYQIIIALTFL